MDNKQLINVIVKLLVNNTMGPVDAFVILQECADVINHAVSILQQHDKETDECADCQSQN